MASVTVDGNARVGLGPFGPGTPTTVTGGFQEAVDAVAGAGGGTVQVGPGAYALAEVVHLRSGVQLVFQQAVVRCPSSKPGLGANGVANVRLSGQVTFVAGAPQQAGIVITGSRQVSLDGPLTFSGWTGPTGVAAVVSQGNTGVLCSGWRTGDSSMLLSIGDTNLEIGNFEGMIAPTGPCPTKAFVHVGTNANFPRMQGVRMHDMTFDGGGLLDVSFLRIRLDVVAGRSGSDVQVQRISCRNGSPTSIWSDCFDSYGIVGCAISEVTAVGCYTGVSVANSQCTVTNCSAIDCFSQGLVVGGAGQLGAISDVTVTNFVARGCCRGTQLGPVVNAQILVAAVHGSIRNARLVNCQGLAQGAPHSLHGLSVIGALMQSCSVEGGQFSATPPGRSVLQAAGLPAGTLTIR